MEILEYLLESGLIYKNDDRYFVGINGDSDVTDIINGIGNFNLFPFTCEDCGESHREEDGRYYKYEAGVWLCDGCWDDRMREEDE